VAIIWKLRCIAGAVSGTGFATKYCTQLFVNKSNSFKDDILTQFGGRYIQESHKTISTDHTIAVTSAF